VRPLFLSQVVEQLSNACVLGSRRSAFVKTARLDFNGAGLLPHGFEAKRSHEPDRLALHEPLHVLSADEWNVLPELCAVRLDQPASVPRLLGSHPVEHRRGRRKVLSQTLGKVGVDALVFFLQRNGKGEDLSLRQAVKIRHGSSVECGVATLVTQVIIGRHRDTVVNMQWLLYAFMSAGASALTAILAKLGVEGVPSTLATAIRTVVVLVIAWVMVFALHEQRALPELSKRSVIFLGLSGIATGIAWFAYFRALQLGPARASRPSIS